MISSYCSRVLWFWVYSAIRRERYHDVLTTFSRLADQAEREGKAKATEDIPKGCIKQVNSKGEVTIMRPAKNDDRW